MGIPVAIFPWYSKPDHGEGGIRRVVEAMVKYLPGFGIDPVQSPDEAAVIACHGTTLVTRPGIPMVSHNHGLYWSRYEWGGCADDTNRMVVEAMACAQAHTVPSEWVGRALRRGMLIYPEVVHHGVDYRAWQRDDAKNSGYVLWNKARVDPVSDPAPMDALAKLMPHQWFVSTFGTQAPNVRIVERTNYEAMRRIVQDAGVYLCTTRETFGIGTIEAMAAGVPVAGWAWGGQLEIVQDGITGYLAPPGDYPGLVEAIQRCLAERDRLSANCRQDVLDRWEWPDKIAQYAAIYRRLAQEAAEPRPKVSVVVTCHNLARYLGAAIRSVQSQDLEDWECIVVDDASTDGTVGVTKVYTDADKRIRYSRTPENLGLPGARNFGWRQSKGRYVIFLDADDMLADHALATCAAALDAKPDIHIATGHLDVVDEQGQNRRRNDWPGDQFEWYGQMAHMNQIHYASMMRREVLERSGGYRERDWRAEDAGFWCRVTSLGFRASKVTKAATLIYRDRSDSKSKGEPGDGPWTEWFGWALAFKFDRNTVPDLARRPHPMPDLVPFGAQGLPRKEQFWKVHDFTEPGVSIVIPVGPGHEKYVIDALDSLMAQQYLWWEAIVVNDTHEDWPNGPDSPMAGAPYARVIRTNGGVGPAAARNAGAKFARAKGLLFLDADDYLLPGALEKMVGVFSETGGIVYSDVLQRFSDHRRSMEPYATSDFVCGAVLRKMQHSSQVLVPREAHEKVGGFDVAAPGWEDWDYLIALQAAGMCSYRIAEPLFVYRKETGDVREASFAGRRANVDWIRAKWLDYYEGRKQMPCGSCPGGSRSAPFSKASIQAAALGTAPKHDGAVLLAYQGPGPKRVNLRGPATDTIYQFKRGEFRYVDVRDANDFLGRQRADGTHDFVGRQEALPPEAPPPPKTGVPAKPFDDVPEMDDIPSRPPENWRLIASIDEEQAKQVVRSAPLDQFGWMIEAEKAGENRASVIGALHYWRARKAKALEPAR